MKTAENKNQNQKVNNTKTENQTKREFKMKSMLTIIFAVILTANLNAQWNNDYDSYDSYESSTSLYNNSNSIYNNSNSLSSGWTTQTTTIRPYKDVYGNSYSNQNNLWNDQDNDGLVGYYDNNDRNSSWSASTKINTNIYNNNSYYNSTPSYDYNSNKTIQTGSRGGQYYINSNGNKTYVNKTNAWGY
ncbi:MAG TPA: hypothetical protein PLK90_01955 [Clostridiales bacterium]|mgnify:CR=1 FL=1|nr:hypothetical protein [Clostridiales bacterium]HQP69140.1 hypothetical protein [Clostridiales bacterium]